MTIDTGTHIKFSDARPARCSSSSPSGCASFVDATLRAAVVFVAIRTFFLSKPSTGSSETSPRHRLIAVPAHGENQRTLACIIHHPRVPVGSIASRGLTIAANTYIKLSFDRLGCAHLRYPAFFLTTAPRQRLAHLHAAGNDGGRHIQRASIDMLLKSTSRIFDFSGACRVDGLRRVLRLLPALPAKNHIAGPSRGSKEPALALPTFFQWTWHQLIQGRGSWTCTRRGTRTLMRHAYTALEHRTISAAHARRAQRAAQKHQRDSRLARSMSCMSLPALGSFLARPLASAASSPLRPTWLLLPVPPHLRVRPTLLATASLLPFARPYCDICPFGLAPIYTFTRARPDTSPSAALGLCDPTPLASLYKIEHAAYGDAPKAKAAEG
ncbi:hypothetical protein C8R44DRAFT_887344 [Mycena epipterygia]|nr:hypothetical protein C8R44DRAFT_887344 [Mycena epipterygia]